MQVNLTQEEQAQISQTIEMFEVITQSQPDDYQSFDILKEAYLKLGRLDDAHAVSRKLADAYLGAGLYSSALLECEGILSRAPDAADVVALMGEIETRMNSSSARTPVQAASGKSSEQNPSLVTTVTTRKESSKKGPKVDPAEVLASDDGNESLAKFLVYQNLAPEEAVATALQNVREKNLAKATTGMTHALVQEVALTTGMDMEEVLSAMLDATKFAYMPIDCYEVDRQIVRMLPDNLTLGRLMVPFDMVSRTLMIAICNPFDGVGKEAAQAALDYNIQWYLASPLAVTKVLKDIYRID